MSTVPARREQSEASVVGIRLTRRLRRVWSGSHEYLVENVAVIRGVDGLGPVWCVAARTTLKAITPGDRRAGHCGAFATRTTVHSGGSFKVFQTVLIVTTKSSIGSERVCSLRILGSSLLLPLLNSPTQPIW
jgi:hypothetical protein